MPKEISESAMINLLNAQWTKLTDQRKANNNRQYEVKDAAMSALSMFHMQSPSFLAFQRDMNRKQGRDNVQSLYKVKSIPSDAQIRNLLDVVNPYELQSSFEQMYNYVARCVPSEQLLGLKGRRCIAWDGTHYYHSNKKSCKRCLTHKDAQGHRHYQHAALMAMQMCQSENEVLALMPEMIQNSDGQEKQDCERNAAHRWLKRHASGWLGDSVIFFGDDLYANQPLCESIVNTYHQHFIFVAKPQSHPWMYDMLGWLSTQKLIQTRQIRVRNGKRKELHCYRWVEAVPLNLAGDAMKVTWLEFTLTDESTGEQIYHNAWVTDLSVDADNVVEYVQLARQRWMIENEGHNTLKRQGYHLEHNFGHGKDNLSATLFMLNLLAFLMHSIQRLSSELYQRLRKELGTRITFFQSIVVLLRFNLFESWLALYVFMFKGLNLLFPDDVFT